MVVSKKKILITGVSGALGQMLAQALSTNFDILGVDKRALPSKLANNKAIQQLKIDL